MSTSTNIDEFKRKILEYGRRLTEEQIRNAPVDLSLRATNAVKRDFLKYLKQSPKQGKAGGTTHSGNLRGSLHPVVRGNVFGVSWYPTIYGAAHEWGAKPYTIYPKATRLVALAIGSGNMGLLSNVKIGRRKNKGLAAALRFEMGGKVIYAKKVNHPGQKARHWASEPMQTELDKYLTDQLNKLNRGL